MLSIRTTPVCRHAHQSWESATECRRRYVAQLTARRRQAGQTDPRRLNRDIHITCDWREYAATATADDWPPPHAEQTLREEIAAQPELRIKPTAVVLQAGWKRFRLPLAKALRQARGRDPVSWQEAARRILRPPRYRAQVYIARRAGGLAAGELLPLCEHRHRSIAAAASCVRDCVADPATLAASESRLWTAKGEYGAKIALPRGRYDAQRVYWNGRLRSGARFQPDDPLPPISIATAHESGCWWQSLYRKADRAAAAQRLQALAAPGGRNALETPVEPPQRP